MTTKTDYLQEMQQQLRQMQSHVEELLAQRDVQQTELEQLRQRVEEVEKGWKCQLLNAFALALDRCSREELEKISLENYARPLQEVLAELEREFGSGKHAG